jgi:hypothetical protein
MLLLLIRYPLSFACYSLITIHYSITMLFDVYLLILRRAVLRVFAAPGSMR